jgi:hypothetical protein
MATVSPLFTEKFKPCSVGRSGRAGYEKETSRKSTCPVAGEGKGLGFAGATIAGSSANISVNRSAAPAAWLNSPHTSESAPRAPAANTE